MNIRTDDKMADVPKLIIFDFVKQSVMSAVR
jgi:hypothetical protein